MDYGGMKVSTVSRLIHGLLHRPYISLDVRTKSAEGLLVYIPAEQEKYHLALYVSKGRIRLSIGRRREIFNRERYNDGKWHTVRILLCYLFLITVNQFSPFIFTVTVQKGMFPKGLLGNLV